MTIHPLIIDAPTWPMPDPVLASIRTAKESLNLGIQVLPQRAVPGPPTRVLALRGVPSFACDAALVSDWRNPESLRNAIRWVLTDEPLEKGFTVADWMRMHLGAVEVTTASDQFQYDEELRQKRFGNG